MAILRANNNTLSSVTALPFATGGLVKLNTTTASNISSIIYDNSLITSTYDVYKIIYTQFAPVTNDITLRCKVSTDNGSNFLTFENGRRYNGINNSNHANQIPSSIGGLMIGRNLKNDSSNGEMSGEFTVAGVNNSSGNKHAWGKAVFDAASDANRYWQDQGSIVTSHSTINYMEIECSSGNISTGIFVLYGLVK